MPEALGYAAGAEEENTDNIEDRLHDTKGDGLFCRNRLLRADMKHGEGKRQYDTKE